MTGPSSPLARMAIVVVSALVVQVVIGSRLRPFGVAPDLFIVLAISGGLAVGAERGAITGFASGLALDLVVVDRPFGLGLLICTLVGYLVGRFGESASDSSRLASIVVAGGATVVAVLVYVVGARLVSGEVVLAGRIPVTVFVMALWSMLLVTPVVAVLRWAWSEPPGVATWAR